MILMICMEFCEHLSKLFSKRIEDIVPILSGTGEGSIDPPSRSEIATAIQNCRPGTTPGENNISFDLLMAGGQTIVTAIEDLFCQIWPQNAESNGFTPEKFKHAKVCMMYKKGDRKDPSNYRSIFLLDCVGIIYVRIITERITEVIDSKLLNVQYGFRCGKSTA